MKFQFTDYFERRVLVKRPYLTREMCARVVEGALREELQDDGERVGFGQQYRNWMVDIFGS